MHQPDAGIHRQGQQAEQFLEGERLRPGGVGNETVTARTDIHRLGRQVLGVDGLDRVVAAPEYGEDREAPQRPGHVVQQQVALAEHQGWPDDGVGYPGIPQNPLHLPLPTKVGQSGIL